MNKIVVTQGHENSIGLEVFIKSFLLLNSSQQEKVVLVCFKETLKRTLQFIKLPYHIEANFIVLQNTKLKIKFLTKTVSSMSESFTSLLEAQDILTNNDILITIPTSKEEIKDCSIQYTGHTDYFRKRYTASYPVMLFISEHSKLALLTEHISLDKVESEINEELIIKKVEALISSPYEFKRFIFTGINPHCGEGGIIGSIDAILMSTIIKLRKKYKYIEFESPVSGDTVLMESYGHKPTDCIISGFHDQGLSAFKTLSGIRASNITIGLPFLRLSPDHGTAFDLYGKNKSNYFGMLYTVKEALRKLK